MILSIDGRIIAVNAARYARVALRPYIVPCRVQLVRGIFVPVEPAFVYSTNASLRYVSKDKAEPGLCLWGDYYDVRRAYAIYWGNADLVEVGSEFPEQDLAF